MTLALQPRALSAALILLLALTGCTKEDHFSADAPARGPGSMIETSGPITDGNFRGGDDPEIFARNVAPPADGTIPDCGAACVDFCQSQSFENPVNIGLCPSLWGVGLAPSSIDRAEACRRLHVDVLGRFPTQVELNDFCDDRPWGEIVSELLDTQEFVDVNRRNWADQLLYNTGAISVERIFDMDDLVSRVYRGEIAYDHFASIVSAHPVFTRRHDTAGDRAEALFHLFLGRPPLGHERSDIARLYNLWHNGYYDHPQLGLRLSDSFIRYRCVNDDGNVDPDSRGECTSILYGYNELILTPDIRIDRDSGRMWSGLLRLDEWEKLQLPGRILATQDTFWEHAVDQILDQYLDYPLTTSVPEVRNELVRHLLDYDGDIRSVHHAVLTSVAYLQSATEETPTDHRWTHGPLKQIHAEAWIDTISSITGLDLPGCDHRISDPRSFLRAGTISGMALIENSDWELRPDGNDVHRQYANLAQNLGGCPTNEVNGRFRIVSILTTSTQLNFVNQVCNPSMEANQGADIASLLPPGMHPDLAVTADAAEEIVDHQTRIFYARQPTSQERSDARLHGETCALERCRAAEFARPACFALLSSSEMLFY